MGIPFHFFLFCFWQCRKLNHARCPKSQLDLSKCHNMSDFSLLLFHIVFRTQINIGKLPIEKFTIEQRSNNPTFIPEENSADTSMPENHDRIL